MQKKDNSLTYVIGAIASVIIIVVIFITSSKVLFGKSEEFYSLEEKSGISKDDYVELYVDGVVGNYAETKHYTNLIPTGTDQHYMLWLETDEIISLTVKDKKLIARLDEICDDTWEYLESDSDYYDVKGTTVKGVIRTIDPEIEGYYKQWINETGIAEAELPIIYLAIDTTDTPTKYWGYIAFFSAVAIGCIVGIIFSIKAKKDAEEAMAFANNYRNMNAEETNTNPYANTYYNPTDDQSNASEDDDFASRFNNNNQ